MRIRFLLVLCLAVILLAVLTGCERQSKRLDRQPQKETEEPVEGSWEWPEYSELFEEVLKLEKEGDLQGALRVIPEIYEEEVPVSQFYVTLDKTKSRLLESLSRDGDVRISGDLGFQDYLHLYNDLLARPDRLHSEYRADGDLPLERYYYFLVVAEKMKDPAKLATSLDPWLVSAALFLARKGELKVEAQKVINRWEERPDLWLEVCDEQALLFLATLPRDELESLEVTNEDIAATLEELKEPSGVLCAVHALLFMTHPRHDLGLTVTGLRPEIWLERIGKGDRREAKTKVDLTSAKGGLLRLNEGRYILSHVSGSGGRGGEYAGVHGTGKVFEAKKGIFTRLLIPVKGGV